MGACAGTNVGAKFTVDSKAVKRELTNKFESLRYVESSSALTKSLAHDGLPVSHSSKYDVRPSKSACLQHLPMTASLGSSL